MTEQEKNNKDKKNLEEEMKSIKEEMKELKEILRDKAESESFEEEVNVGGSGGSDSAKGFRIEFGDDGSDYSDVGSTLGEYLNEVMQGVAQNISNSMKQMTSGFQFEDIAKEMEHAKHEMKQSKDEIKREAKRAARKAKRAAKKVSRNGQQVIRFQPLSEEELDRFYEKAPDLTAALSDQKKLQLLKALEKEPMYQKDLSESTGIRGGTFKHHMDPLLEVQYVAQEAVRGRYFITQLGVEALKLSEMLFRRYDFITQEEAQAKDETDDQVSEEADDDISKTEESVDELQNEEDEG